MTTKRMINNTGSIEITLDTFYPPAAWEKIEDLIAEALAKAGYRGSITNSVTLNSTTIERKKKK